MRCDLGLWVDGDVSPLALNTGRVRRWMQECLGYDDSDDSPAPSPNPPADGRGAPLGATGAADSLATQKTGSGPAYARR